jgi:hypothetical protein
MLLSVNISEVLENPEFIQRPARCALESGCMPLHLKRHKRLLAGECARRGEVRRRAFKMRLNLAYDCFLLAPGDVVVQGQT